MEYKVVAPKEAYTLQNAGGLVLICTKGRDGRYDLAPIAWCCPLDYDPVSRFICVLDISHKTFKDLEVSKEFAIALPGADQKDLVNRCGSISGNDVDKYDGLGIEAFSGKSVDVKIPAGVVGWVECSLSGLVLEGTSAIIMGDTIHAEAAEGAWKERIHFVTDGLFFRPGALS